VSGRMTAPIAAEGCPAIADGRQSVTLDASQNRSPRSLVVAPGPRRQTLGAPGSMARTRVLLPLASRHPTAPASPSGQRAPRSPPPDGSSRSPAHRRPGPVIPALPERPPRAPGAPRPPLPGRRTRQRGRYSHVVCIGSALPVTDQLKSCHQYRGRKDHHRARGGASGGPPRGELWRTRVVKLRGAGSILPAPPFPPPKPKG
jgi:hypothetical protein